MPTSSDHRRRRQLDELRELCRRGALARAIDLAFEHFASFGPDEGVVALLEALAERDDHRRRLVDLRAVQP
jgi:hypothetical protein